MDIGFQKDVIRFPGRFDSAELERDYRASLDLLMVQRMFVLLVVVLAVNVVFMFNDFRMVTNASVLMTVLASRVLLVSVLFGALLALRRPAYAPQTHSIVFAALFMTAIMVAAVPFTRPPEYTGHVAFGAVAVYLFYVFFPVPLALQIIPGTVVTAASLFLIIAVPTNPNPSVATAATISYGLVHALGIFISVQGHYSRRREFSLATRQKTLIRELNEAMGQIRTLRGFVPICSHCKDIRDEQGNWSSLETYLTRHTHGQLSHGICPGCLKKHYPEYAEGV